MSRAAVSKSRADKGAKPPQSHTPVVAHEIVPGKFNDQDWSFMLDKDSSEDVVDKIMEELVDTTMDNIYKLYTERQLLPFTVSQAKDAILSIVEWQFLSRDEGEVEIDNDQSWMEDEEPEPAFTDCWAQGSVPKQLIPPRPMSPVAEIFLEHPDDKDEDIVPGPEREETKEEDKEAEKEDEVTEEAPAVKEDSGVSSEEKKKEEKKRKFKFKPYKGRIKSGGLNKLMSESLEQTEMKMWAAEIEASYEQSMERTSGLLNMPASCHSILKVQSGRPPGNKDVLYDDMGNVVAVVKLNPDKLPSHRVKVNYQIVDPSVEAAQARLDAMRHGKFTRLYLKKKKPALEEFDEATDLQEMKATESKTDLPPPLIEAMELAPGVTVKESGRVRRGPARYIRKSDILSTSIKGLHPVNTHSTRPPLEVTDLLDRHTPILRPIRDSPPLPPIIPSPPSYKRQVST